MLDNIPWIIGILVIMFGSIIGAVYAKTLGHSRRLQEHGEMLAAIESLPQTMKEVQGTVNTLAIDVAVIKKSINSEKR